MVRAFRTYSDASSKARKFDRRRNSWKRGRRNRHSLIFFTCRRTLCDQIGTSYAKPITREHSSLCTAADEKKHAGLAAFRLCIEMMNHEARTMLSRLECGVGEPERRVKVERPAEEVFVVQKVVVDFCQPSDAVELTAFFSASKTLMPVFSIVFFLFCFNCCIIISVY